MDARWILRFPLLFSLPAAERWLAIQVNLGLVPATIDAYGRALVDYLRFCQQQTVVVETATREHIARYVHQMATQPLARPTAQRQVGLANATMQQRLVAVRLFYDFLVEEGLLLKITPFDWVFIHPTGAWGQPGPGPDSSLAEAALDSQRRRVAATTHLPSARDHSQPIDVCPVL